MYIRIIFLVYLLSLTFSTLNINYLPVLYLINLYVSVYDY